MSRTTDKRAELESYIATSRRVQRKLKLIMAGALVTGAALWPVHSTVGLAIVLAGLFNTVVGFYITGVRIHDWQRELYDLDRQA